MFTMYLIHLGILVAIYCIVAAALNLSIGFTGFINLGHIGFFAIGAYASALLTIAGLPFPLAFFAAGVIAALAAPLVVLATTRLTNDYVAVATLGFSLGLTAVLTNWVSLTGGPTGIAGIPKPVLFGFAVVKPFAYLVFAVVVAGVSLWLLHRLTTSRYGSLLGALRDDAIGLAMLGTNVAWLKVESVMISAFFAGLAGSLFAHYLSFIEPKTFSLSEIILVVSIVIIGGLGSLYGTVFATVLVLLLPEALRFFSLPATILGPARQLGYAVLIIVLLRFRPRGLFGTIDLE